MDNIVETIKNEDMTLDELSDIVKVVLSKIYTKIESEIGIHNPIAMINSIGSNSYDVDIRFMPDECYDGEGYYSIYRL
jgi:hypothetical protein